MKYEVCITRRSMLFAWAGGFSLIATARAEQLFQPTRKSDAIIVSNVRVFDGVNALADSDGTLKIRWFRGFQSTYLEAAALNSRSVSR